MKNNQLRLQITNIFFLILCLAVLISIFDSWLRVKNIDCLPSDLCSELTQSIDQVLIDQRMIGFNHTLPLKNLLANKHITLIKLEKKWPHSILINIEQLSPQYIIQSASEVWGIDAQGNVFSQAISDQLPIVLVDNDFNQKQNEQINPNFSQAVLALTQFLGHNDQISFVQNQFFIIPEQNRQIIFDVSNLNLQIKKYQLLKEAKIWENIEEDIFEVDMRFDMPILRANKIFAMLDKSS